MMPPTNLATAGWLTGFSQAPLISDELKVLYKYLGEFRKP
jgi:hypothetical protein